MPWKSLCYGHFAMIFITQIGVLSVKSDLSFVSFFLLSEIYIKCESHHMSIGYIFTQPHLQALFLINSVSLTYGLYGGNTKFSRNKACKNKANTGIHYELDCPRFSAEYVDALCNFSMQLHDSHNCSAYHRECFHATICRFSFYFQYSSSELWHFSVLIRSQL